MSYAIIDIIFGTPCRSPQDVIGEMERNNVSEEKIEEFDNVCANLNVEEMYSAGGEETPAYIGFRIGGMDSYESESWEDLNSEVLQGLGQIEQKDLTELRNKIEALPPDVKQKLEVKKVGIYTIWSDS
jgi:hypothetical protein